MSLPSFYSTPSTSWPSMLSWTRALLGHLPFPWSEGDSPRRRRALDVRAGLPQGGGHGAASVAQASSRLECLPGFRMAAVPGGRFVTAVIAGAASGLLMASVFACSSVLMLFPIVKDPTPGFQAIMHKFPPGGLAMSLVFVAYPVWGIVGAVMGLLYEISTEQAPGPGLGSPNLVFTTAILAVAVMMTAPFLVLLRRVLAGVLAIAAAFIAIFGWLLPYFAA